MTEDTSEKTLVSSEHPFDDPKIIAVIEKYAPEYVDKLRKATRPTVSENPDDLEQWEANQIQRASQQRNSESDFVFLTRYLYEGTFRITSFPPYPVEGSNAPSIGGLVSHLTPRQGSMDLEMETVAKSSVGWTLKEALVKEPDLEKRKNLARMALEITYPKTKGGDSIRPISEDILALNPESRYFDDLDSYGFRLLALYREVPEMNENLRDKGLRDFVGAKDDQKFTKAEAIVALWHKFAKVPGQIFNEFGYFRQENEERAAEGLKNLLYIRTHPELQFYYRYFSPSGYLNVKKTPEYIDSNRKPPVVVRVKDSQARGDNK